MYNVQFKKGTAANYAALAQKDAHTFYYLTDTDQVYLGELELTTESALKTDVANAKSLTTDSVKGNQALYDAIQSMTGGAGSISEQINAAIAALNGDTYEESGTDGEIDSSDGTINTAIHELKTLIAANAEAIEDGSELIGSDSLDTTAQTLTGAINELKDGLDDLTTGSAITLTKDTTVSGVAARYTLSQGGTALGTTIDIPKDMVVESGEVVDLTEQQAQAIDTNFHAGTYIKLTIANATEDELYIPANALVDEYTAAQNATQVQVAINNRVVSAAIVAGSIGTTELANGAVTTLKIADDAVTEDKIADAVMTKINAGNSALQASDITSGSANGTISVDGTNVAVHGLGTAAYTASTDYATAAQGALADSALQAADITEGSTNGTISVDGSDVAVHGLGSAAYTATNAYATAAQGAKADTAIQGIAEGASNGQIKYTVDGTNYTNVNVHGLGSAAYTASTDYDASGSAAAAEANAKTYTDTALTWGNISA